MPRLLITMGLFSTARDYMHFEQMLVNKGTLFGHRLLKPETVAMMSTNQVGNLFHKARKGGAGLGYGYTVGITMDPDPTIFARDQRWKLYNDGRLYDISEDVLEQNPVTQGGGEARAKLQAVLGFNALGRVEDLPS